MRLSEYQNIYENEGSHFFYIANHQLILSLLDKYLSKKRSLKILDAGCGTGLLTQKLRRYGDVMGLDFSPEALRLAKKRRVKTKLGSVMKIPFKQNSFDVVVSIDVLYHKEVKSDLKALREFHRVLKPGGLLVLRVPANKWLRLAHDKHVQTKRRFEKVELFNKLKIANFSVLKISYVNAALLPLVIATQIKEFILPPRIDSGVKKVPDWLNRSLAKLLSIELPLIRNFSLPFGLGLAAVCRK